MLVNRRRINAVFHKDNPELIMIRLGFITHIPFEFIVLFVERIFSQV